MKNTYQYRSSVHRLALISVGLLICVPSLQAAPGQLCNSPVTVVSGDTLSGIAQRCRSSVSALLANNPQIDESGALRVGDSLYLPTQSVLFSAQQLDDLLAPIALHPDVLLAEMLPAATYPLDIVQAARWQERNKRSEVGESEPWDSSVKALTRYPDVLAQMNEDIDWTSQLGEAFLAQPDDVFASIQRLRRHADAMGQLKDNEVQDIVTERASQGTETIIRIVHADPNYVHVPSYDPSYVYGANTVYVTNDVYRPSAHRQRGYNGVHFSVGFLLGGWLSHTLDWHYRHLFYQPYHATAYNRYYGYRQYRPYTSYNRSLAYYGASPYRGWRWRHNSQRPNFQRYTPRPYNAHRYSSARQRPNNDNAHARRTNRYATNGSRRSYDGPRYQGRGYQGQSYQAPRAVNQPRLVNNRVDDRVNNRVNSQANSQQGNSNRSANRDVRRDSHQTAANSRANRQQRSTDIKTELWKGEREPRSTTRRTTTQRHSRVQSAPRSKPLVNTTQRTQVTRSARPRQENSNTRSAAPRQSSQATRSNTGSSRRSNGRRQLLH